MPYWNQNWVAWPPAEPCALRWPRCRSPCWPAWSRRSRTRKRRGLPPRGGRARIGESLAPCGPRRKATGIRSIWWLGGNQPPHPCEARTTQYWHYLDRSGTPVNPTRRVESRPCPIRSRAMPEGKRLWEPSDAAGTALGKFIADRGFTDYDELWRWSVEDLEGFWGAIWDRCEVEASQPYERVLGRQGDARRRMVSGRPPELRAARSAHGPPGRPGAHPRRGGRRARRDELARARRSGRALRGRAAAAGGEARGPRGRLPAERARGGGGSPGLGEHRGGVVELCAGVRRARR